MIDSGFLWLAGGLIVGYMLARIRSYLRYRRTLRKLKGDSKQ